MGRYEATNGTIIPSAKIRAYLYGIVAAASPVVVARGLLDASEVGLWVALGGAILGVTNGIALANTGDRK